MKQTFALAALVGVSMAATRLGEDHGFIQWSSTNNKSYTSTSQFKIRQSNYLTNNQIINSKNAEADPSDPDALILGHNWTSDLSKFEFLGLLGLDQDEADDKAVDGLEMGNSSGSGILSSVENSTNNGNMLGGLGGLGGFGRLEKTHRATDVDWAYDGKMGDVKDQGGCGSCWAFAATTTLEGTHAIKSNQDPVHLSEQQIVDCTLTTNPDNERRFGKDYKAHGCEGGWMQWAWSFMKDHGVMRDSDYRYTSGNTGVETKCEHNEAKVVGKVEGYGQVTTSVEDVKRKLKQQPLAVAVRADQEAFRFYKNGVVKESDGCDTQLNHAVVLVGYTDKDDETDPEPNPNPQPTGEWTVTKWWHNAGVQGGHNSRRLADEKNLSNYWKVQNSWGTGWGDEGFIRIEITDGKGVCGINQVVEWVDMA